MSWWDVLTGASPLATYLLLGKSHGDTFFRPVADHVAAELEMAGEPEDRSAPAEAIYPGTANFGCEARSSRELKTD
jgi:hypothetical protein